MTIWKQLRPVHLLMPEELADIKRPLKKLPKKIQDAS